MIKNPSSNKLVWHYTDSDGLKSIIETGQLWASALNQLNDAAELEEGRQRLEAAVRKLSSNFPNDVVERVLGAVGSPEAIAVMASTTYSLSASKEEDNLSLWRFYGGDASYAIGLDKNVRLFPYTEAKALEPVALVPEPPEHTKDGYQINSPHVDAYSFSSNEWELVTYDEGNTQYFDNLAEALLTEDASDRQIKLGAVFFQMEKHRTLATHKHSSFKAEEELRLVFKVEPKEAYVQYRATPEGLKHYIRVAAAETNDAPHNSHGHELYDCLLEDHSKLPIREVRLSPIGHRHASKQTLKDFLELHGYPDVKVEASNSPFMG